MLFRINKNAGLQAVGGALQSFNDSKIAADERIRRAANIKEQLDLDRQQVELTTSKLQARNDELDMEAAASLASAKALSGRWNTPEELEALLGQVPAGSHSNIVHSLQAMFGERDEKGRVVRSFWDRAQRGASLVEEEKQKKMVAGAFAGMHAAFKELPWMEGAFAAAAEQYAKDGDPQHLLALTQQATELTSRQDSLKVNAQDFKMMMNNPSAMAFVRPDAKTRATELIAQYERMAQFNPNDVDTLQDLQRKIFEEMTPNDVRSELEAQRDEITMLRAQMEASQGLPGEVTMPGPEIAGEEMPAWKDAEDIDPDRAVRVSQGIGEFLDQYEQGTGVSLDNLPDDYTANLISRWMYETQGLVIAPSDVLEFTDRITNDPKSFSYPTTHRPFELPSSYAIREKRQILLADKTDDALFRKAGRAGISIEELRGMVNNPEDPPSQWRIEETERERQAAKKGDEFMREVGGDFGRRQIPLVGPQTKPGNPVPRIF